MLGIFAEHANLQEQGPELHLMLAPSQPHPGNASAQDTGLAFTFMTCSLTYYNSYLYAQLRAYMWEASQLSLCTPVPVSWACACETAAAHSLSMLFGNFGDFLVRTDTPVLTVSSLRVATSDISYPGFDVCCKGIQLCTRPQWSILAAFC